MQKNISKHWEHSEYLPTHSYDALKLGSVEIKPSVGIEYNTALYVYAEGRKPLECIYDGHIKSIRPIKGKGPNRDLRLYTDAVMNENITVMAVDGLPGTGKTSTLLKHLINKNLSDIDVNERVLDGVSDWDIKPSDRKILIAKPAINADGEEYGFLPGDINEKIVPTLSNYTQYFDRYHPAGFELLRAAGYVEVLPLGFVRGRDAENIDVVVDECQNTKELITMVTRRAIDSRIFLLGDTTVFQIDRPGNTPSKNGLADVIDLLKGAHYFMHIEMKALEHIVRSEEVRDVMRRLFNRHGEDPKEWVI